MKTLKDLKLELLFFFFFVLLHLPALGHDNFNTDVWKWKARSYDFGSGVFGGDFEKTIQKYHPGVTLMWLGTLGVKVINLYYDVVFKSPPLDNNIEFVFQLDFLQKLLIVLVTSATLTSCVFALRKVVNSKFALLAGFLLALEPFYMALTRVMHLEGMMSTFMLASALWLYYFLSTARHKHLFLSAFFAALAILTKTSAIYLVLFTGFSFLVMAKTNFKQKAKDFCLWFLEVLAIFIVLWPAMWTHTLQALSVMYRGIFVIGVERDHIQYYFSRLVDSPGPEYYFVILALRASPLLFVGLLLLFWQRKQIKTPPDFFKFLGAFTFFYILELTIPSKKLDRYILPALMSLTIMSAYGFYLAILRNKNLIVLPLLAVIFPLYLHPDYFSYYNPMFGGLGVGVKVIEPKWLIGQREITRYFNAKLLSEGFTPAPTDASLEELARTNQTANIMVVAFPEKYYTQVWPFFRENRMWAVIEDMTALSQHAKYFVYPVWEDLASSETRFKLEQTADIKIRGVSVYKVYKKL